MATSPPYAARHASARLDEEPAASRWWYAQLSSAVTNGDRPGEQALLAPHFEDRSKAKLSSFEYDPLTVEVSSIARSGKNALIVHATYYGVHGHREPVVDQWILVGGQWRLLSHR
ncbi:MAG TPA: hypothetical protein VIK27_05800 [Candidatus Aquilonibacter sp.]